ncbi:e1-E2 ATPase domain-containing protein [Ditylenchus destructor]|nr:e1-E2 ATPase domain-containing protein [Ditylenchus destructor]
MNGNNKVHDQNHTNGTPTVVFSSGDEDNGEASKEQNGASATPQSQSHLSPPDIKKKGSFASLTHKLGFGHGSASQLSKSSSKANNLSASYHEHTWDIRETIRHNKDSNIDKENPERSKGLSSQKAREFLEQNGPNKLPAPKEISDWKLFIKQFMNMLWILLGVAAALTLVSYFADTSDMTGLWVTIILYVMIVVMCFISFYQEREARKVVRGFQNLLPSSCSVIRDGNETVIGAEDLVVGDIVKLKSGTKVPADIRVLHCTQLKLETSSITGESEPVEYQFEAVAENVNIFDARNVAFNGSYCVDGDGVGVVIKTATDTIIGQIAIGLSVFVIGGLVHKWDNIVLLLATSFAVCSVSMIPEGMPATVTSILTLVARRLARKNVYLKRLDIVEALGSANIIASDKTGTLTKNEMTVTDVWYSNEYVTDISEHRTGHHRTMTVKTISRVEAPLSDLLVAMTICNTASFDESNDPKKGNNNKEGKVRINMPTLDENGELSKEAVQNTVNRYNTVGRGVQDTYGRGVQNTIQRRRKRIEQIQGKQAVGAPSEVALIKYAEQLINVHDFRKRYNVVFEIPFNSRRKFHLVIAKMHEIGNGQHQYLLIMKGAPEILIQKCSTILTTDEETELTENKKNEFQKAYNTYGEHGRRVIGFTHKHFNAPTSVKFNVDEGNFPLKDLVFVGICAIMDPPRDETERAIRECQEAGIKVFMVTGDHHITATAIAKQIGLIGKEGNDWDVVKGEDIPKLTDQQWDKLVAKRSLVFARTTPEQKLRIVEECQKRKQIIAMTGDGVNDAPALKKSDIGVGMGSGSDVAKQAADIVLTDDNFSSMVGSVREGRLMFDNIKKLMVYVLCHTFPELWGIIINFCFGMPIGTTSLIILSIDLGTEILPGIAMCKEPLEGDVMKRPPRKEGKILIGKALLAYVYGYNAHIQAIGCFLAYCTVFWNHNINISDLWMSALDSWKHGGAPFISNGRTFSVEEQLYINRQACSAWQVGIVFGQVFNVFCARTLRQSIFTQGLFSNMAMNIAIIAEIIMLLIFVYVPGVNSFLGGAPVPWQSWAVVAVVGMFVFSYNEVRKYCIRRWPENKIVRAFKF